VGASKRDRNSGLNLGIEEEYSHGFDTFLWCQAGNKEEDGGVCVEIDEVDLTLSMEVTMIGAL
jgi:hypothetical protein